MKANLIIRASAGTGKTFSLATRFIRLMLFQHVAPERIVALTFSRAAAQEIYVKLLERLWKAARTDDGARAERALLLQGLSDEDRAAVEASDADFSRAAFAETLRRVVDAQEGRGIATLDSFILRIVRSFPLEMGFQNAVDVLDGYGETAALARARDRLLCETSPQTALEEAFRTAQRGDFVRTCVSAFGTILGAWRQFLADHPAARTWTADTMCDALGVNRTPMLPDLSRVPLSGKSTDPRDKAVAHLQAFAPGMPLFPDTKAGELLRFLAENPAETVYAYTTPKGQVKSFDCCAEGAAALRDGVRYMVDAALRAQLEVVAAKLRLCALVEDEYGRTTRRQGLLTFSDFTDCQAVKEDSDEGLRLQNLQFRFDARFDHWALDEFQDTSAVQWLCLRRLVREAADDPARTVMAVGDLKQSIYAWRGGDDGPFKEILEDWDAFRGENGESVQNDVSFRYAKHTADFINRVFGPENLRHAPCLNGACADAVERWLDASCWMTHKPDARNGVPKADDYVELVAVSPAPVDPDAEAAAADDTDEEGGSAAMRQLGPKICERVRDLWRRHESLPGGQSSTDTIGILVRNNRDGAYLAELLRNLPDEDIPVVWEGADGVLDAPVVRGVVELLKLAAHPEDTYAWETVNRLFPIRERVFPELAYPVSVAQEVSRMLSHLGLARTLREIVARLTADDSGLSARSVARLEALVRAGVNFEARKDGADALEDFPSFLASAAGRELAASPHVVRILTIHRSKGLTLDHVIVPILESGKKVSVVKPRTGTVLTGEGWALEASSEVLMRQNPVLASAWAKAADERLVEQLRLNYVALTRARKTTSVFFLRGDHEGVTQFRDLLTAPFGGTEAAAERVEPWGDVVFASGSLPAFGCKESSATERATWSHGVSAGPVAHRSPSVLKPVRGPGGALPVGELFASGYGAAAVAGTARHAAWAQIEWIDPDAPKDDLERQMLSDPAWRQAFVLPDAQATVWRERGYELFDGQRWETGQFDRVVFAGSGPARTATVYDFKTNRPWQGESDAAFGARMQKTYAQQLSAYRTALAELTGLPPERITAHLLLEPRSWSAC